MADANEKDEASKLDSIPDNDAEQPVIAPPASNAIDSELPEDMEEDEYDDDEESEEEEDEDEDEEFDDDEELEDEDGEEEIENNGGTAMVAVNDVGLNNTDEDHNKGKGIVEETNKEKSEEKDTTTEENKSKIEEPKNGEELVENSTKKERKPRIRNKKKAAEKVSDTATADGDNSKPESSTRKKRVESMGMVFMCSSKTKTDCFRYKILGLPANKKDQVAKIYKGMRLFLFDVDLRLMYGIFKAAGPGGYNIEPKAFKSEFPSQVRFIVMEDCLPVAEEKFKDVLKENYYTRNKFEGLLKGDQVKKLCKLFAGTGKRSRTAIKSRRPRPVETRGARPDSNRVRPLETRSRRSRAEVPLTSRDQKKRKRRPREEERRPRPRPRSPPTRDKRRYTDYPRSPVLYDREPVPPPAPRYLPLGPPPASPVRSYNYDNRPLDLHHPSYTRDRVHEPRMYRVLDHVETRHHHDEILDRTRDWDRERDPYYMYGGREAPPPYRDTVYNVPPPAPEYHIVSRDSYHPVEYRIPGGPSRVPSYRDVGPAADYPEYRSHRTHYRY